MVKNWDVKANIVKRLGLAGSGDAQNALVKPVRTDRPTRNLLAKQLGSLYLVSGIINPK